MEKEILIQNLRTKLGDDKSSAISDRTMEAFADMWLPRFNDDSKITDDTWKEPITFLTNYAGQKLHDDAAMADKLKKEIGDKFNADLAQKIKDAESAAIAKYIKEHPQDNGGGNGGNGGGNGNGGNQGGTKTMEELVAEQVAAAMANLTKEDGVIGKLNTTLGDFIKTNQEKERNQSVANMKARLTDYLKEKGASNIPAIEDALLDIEYGDKLDFDELKAKVTAAYEARFKRYFGDGGKPFGGGSQGGNGGGNGNGLSEDIKAYIDQAKKDAAETQNYSESLTKNFV